MSEVKVSPTEAEMRDAKVPWPKTGEELSDYIKSLVDRPHDYGTSAYAMGMAAQAAFNYIGHALGTTAFQASCADMDFLRRTRHMEHGFQIVDYSNILYPQYWNMEGRVAIFREVLRTPEGREKFAEAAKKLLAEDNGGARSVRAHWAILAAGEMPK